MWMCICGVFVPYVGGVFVCVCGVFVCTHGTHVIYVHTRHRHACDVHMLCVPVVCACVCTFVQMGVYMHTHLYA